METNQEQENTDFLQDVISYRLVRASTGKRFANYIIDLILFYALFVLAGIAIALVKPELLDGLDDSGPSFDALDRIITMILFGVYIFIVEAVFKGKTLGKLITGTRAVNQDGTPITVVTALKRGLSRIVPFEQFSALVGNPSFPWHDKWTDTYVIDENLSNYK